MYPRWPVTRTRMLFPRVRQLARIDRRAGRRANPAAGPSAADERRMHAEPPGERPALLQVDGVHDDHDLGSVLSQELGRHDLLTGARDVPPLLARIHVHHVLDLV